MTRKVLFKGPVTTASGYGVHSRQILRSLLDLGYDVSVKPLNWGNTSFLHTGDIIHVANNLARKYNIEQSKGQKYDISVQVTIPNEFENLARVNVGVTAGIEVDRVAPEWLIKSNEMDAIFVPSEHSKSVFQNTVYQDANGNSLKLSVPIFVCPEGFDDNVFNTDTKFRTLELEGLPEFNFLHVGLGLGKSYGEDRKNIANLVKWFCETFKDNKDIGLVLKTALVNNSYLDYDVTKRNIDAIKKATGCGEYPKVTLVHGRLSEKELAELYKHDNIKAFVSLTHGEGYGLPLLEAAACGLPVITTNWSGHLDFLNSCEGRGFVELDYDLTEIPDSVVWNGVIVKGSRWASVKEEDVKLKLRKVAASYEKPRGWAEKLAKSIAAKFPERVTNKIFADKLSGFIDSMDLVKPRTEKDLVTAIERRVFDGEKTEKSILYTMPMSAGDVFLSTAVVNYIKEKLPDHNIFFATQGSYLDVLKDNDDIHKVIPWEDWMTNVPLCQKVFDYVFTPNLGIQMNHSNWIKHGLLKDNNRLLLEEMFSQCGFDVNEFGANAGDRYRIKTDKPQGFDTRDYIVIHTGSGKNQHAARNYLHWQDIVKNLNEYLGMEIVQVGTSDEPELSGVTSMLGKTSYNELAWIIENARLVLSIDSIAMHMAGAFSIDHVSLFGSSYPEATGPLVKLSKRNITNNYSAEVPPISELLETPDRYTCDKACYKNQCSVKPDHPCINEISPKKVFNTVCNIVESKTEDREYKEFYPSISGYTHVFNAKKHEYPFVESITSLLGFCDEVIVVDGGSNDGTVEDIKAIGDDRIKIFERKWDWDEPGMDGMQKAYGRALCTSEFLWQQDVDEVVHEDDYDKIKKIAKQFPKDVDLIHLPVIELWGSHNTVRTDRHSWKWRMSRNDFRITHGIAKHARLEDPETGKIYAKKGMSDGCEYIDIMTNEYIEHKGFYSRELDELRKNDPVQYGYKMNEIFNELPSVFHYSWCDLERKIKNFKMFWNNCWDQLHMEKGTDRFPDVDLSDVDTLLDKINELRSQGGENPAKTFELDRENPGVMKGWLDYVS